MLNLEIHFYQTSFKIQDQVLYFYLTATKIQIFLI